MQLLKIRENRAYKDRNEDVEFLRDWCCLYFNENLEWELYLNGEIIKGEDIIPLYNLFKKIIKEKEKSHKTKNNQRRLVIWVNRLSTLRNYVVNLGKDMEISKMEKFKKGRVECFIDKITNCDLEFRSFDLISGENLEELVKTYRLKNKGVTAMVEYLKKREEQGLKGWSQIRYTLSNNNLKLFYRKFNNDTLNELREEVVKRAPSLEFYQILMEAPKAGVMFYYPEIQNKMLTQVNSFDISSAYNSQFVRGNDFPIGKVKRVDTSMLSQLYNENKWFLLVMAAEEEVKMLPNWIKPIYKDDEIYYIIGNYDYKIIRMCGLKLSSLSNKWTKYKLFTCEETGYLHKRIREEIVHLYDKRQYLKLNGNPEEKIYKQIGEVLYGKGIQKRHLATSSEVYAYYKRPSAYIDAQISYHALQRTRYELMLMLYRINGEYVACDTDSIKTRNPMAPQLFSERNKEISEENRLAGFPDTKIGLWKFEGCYNNFIQFGNKVYAYEENRKIKCKFAGCLIEASDAYFNSMSLEQGLNALCDPDLIIPNGLSYSVLDYNDSFYLRKINKPYRVRGEINEMD